MATRSIIGYYNEETNQIHATYCHYDGYEDHMFPALRDFITKHGFDAFVSNVEQAAKGGGIRSIPVLAEEWSLFETHEEFRATFPGNVTISRLCESYYDYDDKFAHIEHVYILSRRVRPLSSPQSARIAHVDIAKAAIFSGPDLDGFPSEWIYWDVHHMPETTETTETTGQLSFSI